MSRRPGSGKLRRVAPHTFEVEKKAAGRPIISAEDAIARALEIDDHFEKVEFLKAWQYGDWATVRDYLTGDLSQAKR